MRTWIAPLLAASLLGCPAEETNCDAMAAASLTITLVDADSGAPITDASLSYTANGTTQDCESFVDGEYVCGWEVAGELVVTIEAPGYETTTHTATIAEGECHVIGQAETISLAPSCATDAGVYGVEVSVWGSAMMPPAYPIDDATVTWSIGDEADQPCDVSEMSTHLCAFAREGQVTLTVSASGHETKVVVVDVDHDDAACPPEPEQVDVTLECLAC